MARQPKTTAQHKRDGTYRADRHANRADTQYPVGQPKCPNGLSSKSEKLWRLIVKSLPAGSMSEGDALALTALCRWWEIWKAADAKLDETADWKAMCMAATAWKQCAKLLAEFGLTPAARARIKIIKTTAPAKDNPLHSLIAGRENLN